MDHEASVLCIGNKETFSAAFNRRRARNNQRSGTENVPAIVAMAKALRLHLENEQQRPQHVATLRSYLLKALEEFQNVTVFHKIMNILRHTFYVLL